MKIEEINNGNLNKVYILYFDSKKYIMRVSQFNNDFECSVLNYLKESDLHIPVINTNFIFKDKYIMIYKYIEGSNPTNFNELFFKKLIYQLKKLHDVDVNLVNENTNYESLNKLEYYYNLSINSEYLKNDSKFISDLFISIKNNLKLEKLPQCIIHSDIKKENIIINKNGVYLIDFGNCYVGSRMIDIIRIFMWFFIKDENYDFDKMKMIIQSYFDIDNKITDVEIFNLELLLKFCLIYNLLKDISLFEKNMLKKEYIEKSSLKWLKALKDKKNLAKVLGVLKNAKGFTE